MGRARGTHTCTRACTHPHSLGTASFGRLVVSALPANLTITAPNTWPHGCSRVMATDPTGPSKRQTEGTFFLFSFSANQLTQKSPPKCQVWALAVLREVCLPPPPAMPTPTWQDLPRFCFILSTYGWSAFCLLCCLHRSCPHTRERCLPVGSMHCPELHLKQAGAQQLFVKGMKKSQKQVSAKKI